MGICMVKKEACKMAWSSDACLICNISCVYMYALVILMRGQKSSALIPTDC